MKLGHRDFEGEKHHLFCNRGLMMQMIWNKNGMNITKPKDLDNGYTGSVQASPLFTLQIEVGLEIVSYPTLFFYSEI